MRPYPACLLAALAAAASAAPAAAGILAGPTVNPANGHTYYLLTQNTWTGSEAEAVALGGHLVTINDAAENAWVADTFANFRGVPRALWIGLTDAAAEGTFVWAGGEAVGFTNWGPNEPNDNGGNEDWAHIFPPSDDRFPTWNDAPDAADSFGFSFHGVVEVNAATPAAAPGPPSLVLLGVGGVGLLGYARRRKAPPPRPAGPR